MRRQAFIARLAPAAAVLLKVARVGAAAALTFVLVLPAFPQDQQDATLACDRAAASPTDKNRPFGVPAVFFASIDPQVAIPACQEAAAAAPENPRILFQLGRAYTAAKAYEAARAYFQKASDLGYPPAQANLGTFYAIGRGGLARDDEEALRLSRLAADQGDGLGHNNIGFFYESGRGGLPKDDNAAAQHYKFAAEAGEAWGQYNVGRFYQAGRGGLIANDREAARLYKLAADQRHAPAEVNLGFFYETGRGGLPEDDREALGLYQRAAAQGNAAGQNNVGRFYLNGRGGLPQSDDDAVRLYRLAAEQGNAFAQSNLGFLYETGRGPLRLDEAEAARLYRLAAEQGHPNAQNRLASFYELGRGGLPKNIGEAIRLYKLAAGQDRDPDAKLWATDVLARLSASTAAPSSSVPSLPLVAFLSLGNDVRTSPAFHRGLAEAGFFEGKNVRIEFRASPSNEQLPALAAALMNSRPSVIVATNSPITVLAARAATSTVPIVFASSVDPVAYGFVESLHRPGGNVTGISLLSDELIGKRLSLLLEMAPDARKIAYLSGGAGAPIYNDLRARTVAAGRALGREVIVLDVRNSRDLQMAFTTLVEQGAGAVIVGAFTSLLPMRDRIIALAQQYKVPTMYPGPIYTRAGGLMSYTADLSETDRLLGSQYVGRLLKGIKPSDLPVQQPTKFELVINLKTAKALGLTIPETLLATADEVIQ
jgi:TPR repeat protein/ABC-type uncharacterized transport system substrate-binding protein